MLAAIEVEMAAMRPTHEALEPVAARDAALKQFILEELPARVKFDPAGMTTALQLAIEFNTQIWPHRVPSCHELVMANRAGRLTEAIEEFNNAYRAAA